MGSLIRDLITLGFIIVAFKTSAQKINIIHAKPGVSIRGLSVVDNKTAWVSGSKGSIGLTTDGGKSWAWQQVKGFERSDFRDIEAFNDKEAVILASGSPAVILKTIDGGKNWSLNYRKNHTSYFLDAMDFVDSNHGWIIGDPINGKFLLLETQDAGITWVERQDIAPAAMVNEAAFAASGTCFRVDKSNLYLVTGGVKSRLLIFNQNYLKDIVLPIKQGKPSQGAFSLAINHKEYVIVGGDYVNDKNADSVSCAITKVSVGPSNKGPSGYQSSVEHLGGTIYLATGTSGSNLSRDNGKSWMQINTLSFNVCCKAKKGKLVLLAGNNGQIAQFK